MTTIDTYVTEGLAEPIEALEDNELICDRGDCGREVYVDPDGNGWHVIDLTPWSAVQVRVKH